MVIRVTRAKTGPIAYFKAVDNFLCLCCITTNIIVDNCHIIFVCCSLFIFNNLIGDLLFFFSYIKILFFIFDILFPYFFEKIDALWNMKLK